MYSVSSGADRVRFVGRLSHCGTNSSTTRGLGCDHQPLSRAIKLLDSPRDQLFRPQRSSLLVYCRSEEDAARASRSVGSDPGGGGSDSCGAHLQAMRTPVQCRGCGAIVPSPAVECPGRAHPPSTASGGHRYTQEERIRGGQGCLWARADRQVQERNQRYVCTVRARTPRPIRGHGTQQGLAAPSRAETQHSGLK